MLKVYDDSFVQVFSIISVTAVRVNVGFLESIKAAMPETNGVAADVPSKRLV